MKHTVNTWLKQSQLAVDLQSRLWLAFCTLSFPSCLRRLRLALRKIFWIKTIGAAMIRLFFLIALQSCGPYRMLSTDYSTLSESPCVDGTVLNIDQAGCKSFYWGVRSSGIVLKIRCSYAPVRSFWTETDFYAVPHGHVEVGSNWGPYCEDKFIRMYAIPHGLDFEVESEAR